MIFFICEAFAVLCDIKVVHFCLPPNISISYNRILICDSAVQPYSFKIP